MKGPRVFHLAPSFDIPVDGPIRLGDIIADPGDPRVPLSRLSDGESRNVYQPLAPETGSRAREDTTWKTVQNFIQSSRGDTETLFEIEELVTLQYDPTPSELAQRMKDSEVDRYMSSSLFKRRGVYVVTGLKIAKGFRMKRSTHAAGQIQTDVTTASVGGEAETSMIHKVEAKSQESRIVFAYSLTAVKKKGFSMGKGSENFRVEPYNPRQLL